MTSGLMVLHQAQWRSIPQGVREWRVAGLALARRGARAVLANRSASQRGGRCQRRSHLGRRTRRGRQGRRRTIGAQQLVIEAALITAGIVQAKEFARLLALQGRCGVHHAVRQAPHRHQQKRADPQPHQAAGKHRAEGES